MTIATGGNLVDPSDIKNVTPLPAGQAPGPIATSTGGTVGTTVKAKSNMRAIVIAAIVVFVLVLGYKLFHHHRNTYEATADAVTIAIEKNDMTPVLHKFNAIRLPELEDRERVGRLSNLLAPLGEFKGSKEITPAGSDAGFHAFTETFAQGTKYEKYELDADNKIVKFYIGDPPSTSSAP
jgi:hypothetical protein